MSQKTFNKLRKAGRVLAMLCAFTLTAGLAAGAMLEANSDQVNNFLGTRTTRTAGTGDYTRFTPDEEYLNADGSANTDAVVAAHREMGIRLAEEGTVLLKNQGNDALPLAGTEKVTLMGFRSTPAYALYGMDIGSPEASSQNISFKDALSQAGFQVNPTVCTAYETVSATAAYSGANRLSGMGYFVESIGDNARFNIAEPTISEIRESAGGSFDSSIDEYNDAAILVFGRPTAEQGDYYAGSTGADAARFTRSETKNALSFSDNELALIDFAKEEFDKVIVVLTTSNPMEVKELEEDTGVDAILQVGFPGNYGFIGVANILAGKANPSGRLADTFASDTASAPAMQNYGLYLYSNAASAATGGLNGTQYFGGAYIVQAEGIYTGYKYYETRYEDSIIDGEGTGASSSAGASVYASQSGVWDYEDEVVYPFGYGLSYTTFTQKITDVELSDDGRTATVTVSVTNNSQTPGKSVIQLYGQSPYTEQDIEDGVEKASVQLLAFEKVDVAGGEIVTETIEVDMQYLASYDSANAGSYVMRQSDEYYFALGCNATEEGAHAAVNNILAAKDYTMQSGMDSEGDAEAAYKFSWTLPEDTFATTKANTEVSNQLDDLDYNYFDEGTVTYLSRSDWDGTWPRAYSGLSATSDMIAYLTNSFYTPSTNDDVSDITFGAGGDTYFTDMFGSDFDDERWADVLDNVTLENAVAFTASGNRSFQNMQELRFIAGTSYVENGSVGIQKTLSQQSDENSPWYVSPEDENAGYLTNVFGSPVLMAQTWSKDLMEEMGELWGNAALFINIPMVWAPSINIHRTSYNGRNGEYYSEDGVLSGYLALSVGKGGISKGLITAIKHYAFNSQETSRNGISTFMNEQTAREGELRGFQIALEGIYNADGSRTSVLGIMTAYNRAGAVYVGAHTGLMQGILRNEWDFNGYATSDLVQQGTTYMPYIESMLAGTTNFDTTINNGNTVWHIPASQVVSTVSADAELLTAIKQNMHYSLYAFAQSNLGNWMTENTRTVWAFNWWRGAYIGVAGVSGLAILCGLFMYIYAEGIGPACEERKNRKAAQKGGNSNEK